MQSLILLTAQVGLQATSGPAAPANVYYNMLTPAGHTLFKIGLNLMHHISIKKKGFIIPARTMPILLEMAQCVTQTAQVLRDGKGQPGLNYHLTFLTWRVTGAVQYLYGMARKPPRGLPPLRPWSHQRSLAPRSPPTPPAPLMLCGPPNGLTNINVGYE